MPNDTLLQLGVGVLALLVLRDVLKEVIALLKRRGPVIDRLAGDQSVDYWRSTCSELTAQAVDEGMVGVATELHEIRADTTRLRESQHRQVELQQQLIGKLDVLIRLTEARRP